MHAITTCVPPPPQGTFFTALRRGEFGFVDMADDEAEEGADGLASGSSCLNPMQVHGGRTPPSP